MKKILNLAKIRIKHKKILIFLIFLKKIVVKSKKVLYNELDIANIVYV